MAIILIGDEKTKTFCVKKGIKRPSKPTAHHTAIKELTWWPGYNISCIKPQIFITMMPFLFVMEILTPFYFWSYTGNNGKCCSALCPHHLLARTGHGEEWSSCEAALCLCVLCTVQVVTTRDTSVSGGQGHRGECDPEGLGLAAARNCWDT